MNKDYSVICRCAVPDQKASQANCQEYPNGRFGNRLRPSTTAPVGQDFDIVVGSNKSVAGQISLPAGCVGLPPVGQNRYQIVGSNKTVSVSRRTSPS